MVICEQVYVSVCLRLGRHGTFPSEGGAVNSHPETNIRLQLPVRGDHDRRPAQPANHTAAAGAGM